MTVFEIYQLEQLLAFAECGTLSGAAERLHLSQPALSRSMQRLEAELQVPLFHRQKNKIEFNENGRMAADCARQVLDKCQDMISRVQAFDRSQRTILVGSCAPMPLWEIPPTLSDLYPDRTISWEMRENDVLLQGLRGFQAREIAVDLLYQRHPGLNHPGAAILYLHGMASFHVS